MFGGKFRDAFLQHLLPALPALLADRGFGFLAEQFEEPVAEVFGAVALRASAMSEDLVEKDFPRPSREIRAQLELVELPPHDDLALLHHVLRVLRTGDESGHVEGETALVLGEEAEEGLGAVRIGVGDVGGHGVHRNKADDAAFGQGKIRLPDAGQTC